LRNRIIKGVGEARFQRGDTRLTQGNPHLTNQPIEDTIPTMVSHGSEDPIRKRSWFDVRGDCNRPEAFASIVKEQREIALLITDAVKNMIAHF